MDKKEYEELVTTLRAYDLAYYVKAEPLVSDREYDVLYRKLIDYEKEFPKHVQPHSPSLRVGGIALSAFNQIEHQVPMQSLDNTYSIDELRDYFVRAQKHFEEACLSYFVEPKVDGVAVSLRYEEGKLVHGLTRGDGSMGDDITNNLKTLRQLPLEIPTSAQVLEVRGEVFMRYNAFEKLNEARQNAGENLFANARNATAGTLKLLDSSKVAKRPLSIVLYGLGECVGEEIKTQVDLIKRLKELGFPGPEVYWECSNEEEVIHAIEKLNEKRQEFAYPTDGAVIKVNAFEHREKLGSTAKAPRWAIAYKFSAEQAETTLKEITFQVGRTGVITPVAELEAVQLSGTMVSRATLHNFKEIERKDIRVGDRVIVEKAGEIIPVVVEVNKAARPKETRRVQALVKCPVCDEETVQDDVFLRCVNPSCKALLKRKIEHFAHRGAMDIDGMGEAVIEQLVEKKWVKSLDDIYLLKKDQVKDLERMAEKSAQNLIDAIEASKKQPLWRLLFGLGILHVGAGLARQLEKSFQSIDQLSKATVEELENVPDVGTVVAQSLYDFFRSEKSLCLLENLRRHGLKFEMEGNVEGEGELLLAGKKFVITGTLSHSRSFFEEAIRKCGGQISGSVSSKTDYLLAGESAGSKLEKAQKLGVTILNEKEFENLAQVSSEH